MNHASNDSAISLPYIDPASTTHAAEPSQVNTHLQQLFGRPSSSNRNQNIDAMVSSFGSLPWNSSSASASASASHPTPTSPAQSSSTPASRPEQLERTQQREPRKKDRRSRMDLVPSKVALRELRGKGGGDEGQGRRG
jgi:hypothetical protein